MRGEALTNAICEAQRFIQIARKVVIKHEKRADGTPWIMVLDYTKESAACKRASMDLTRALAEMRKCYRRRSHDQP